MQFYKYYRSYLYDIQELVSVYAAVAVNIVKSEVPAQFVLHLPSHYETEGGHVLHEVYITVLQEKLTFQTPLSPHHTQKRPKCKICVYELQIQFPSIWIIQF